jgi:phosphoglycolate phosphatase
MSRIIIDGHEVECSLVLFDLDGTLMDKEERSVVLARSRYASITRLAGREAADRWAELSGVDVSTFTVNHLGPLSKAPRGEDITVAAAAIWLNKLDWFKARDLATEAYREADAQQSIVYAPRLIPGVRETLREMRDAGLILGIATNGSGATAREIMSAIRADVFEVYVGADDVAEGKPSPDMIQEACRRVGVTAGDTVYVGDEPVDAAAGSSAGVKAVVIVGDDADPFGIRVYRLDSVAKIHARP